MANRLLAFRLTLLLPLFFIALGAGLAAAAPKQPTDHVPEAWRGAGTGVSLQWMSAAEPFRWSGAFHHLEPLALDVSVDRDRIEIVSPDGTWSGTVSEGDEHVLLVAFDAPSLAAIEAHVAARLALAGSALGFDPSGLPVSAMHERVEIDLLSNRADFVLTGGVSFGVEDASNGTTRYGRYLFQVSGEFEEVAATPRVLLLGDNGSEPQIEAALLAAGHEVTTLPRYAAWDGVTPDVSDFDVVVYLDGIEHALGLAPAADAAVAAFVEGGGGLVRTEWSLWAGLVNPLIDPMMPLTYYGGFRYGAVNRTIWKVRLPDHPLVAGVDTEWHDLGDYSLGLPYAASEVAVVTHDGYPLVTAGNVHGGTVVHINHALTYGPPVLDPNLLQLFVNAVEYASAGGASATTAATGVTPRVPGRVQRTHLAAP